MYLWFSIGVKSHKKKKLYIASMKKNANLMVSTSVSVIKDAPFYWCFYHEIKVSSRHLHHHKLWCRLCQQDSTAHVCIWGNLKFMDMALNANILRFNLSHGEGINLIKNDFEKKNSKEIFFLNKKKLHNVWSAINILRMMREFYCIIWSNSHFWRI